MYMLIPVVRIFTLIVLLSALWLMAGCLERSYIKEKELKSFFRYSPEKKPIISAHNGGGIYTGYPENCLESFSFVTRQMHTLIEADVASTKDSTLIILADDTYDLRTTGSGKVSEQRWEVAKTFFLKDGKGKTTGYRIPTLRDLLKWGKSKVVFTFDIKKNVPYQRVIDVIQEMKAQNQVVIIAKTHTHASLIHRLDPGIMMQVTINSEADYLQLSRSGVPDERMVAFIGHKEASDELYSFLHSKGIMTILGASEVLDDMAMARGDELYRKFFDNGADILSTTRPLQAGKVLGLIR
jgi:glycerophosphoryl diester phosphodiesterase